MRELTLEEMMMVNGGGGLDSPGKSDAGYGRGGTSSSGASSRGQGAAQGAKGGYDFNSQVEASKQPSNNPGSEKSWIGRVVSGIGDALSATYKGGGTPDMTGYNAMGDYSGFGGTGDGYSGGRERGGGDSGGRGG